MQWSFCSNFHAARNPKRFDIGGLDDSVMLQMKCSSVQITSLNSDEEQVSHLPYVWNLTIAVVQSRKFTALVLSTVEFTVSR